MAWCEDCTKYWRPEELDDAGGCPTCGSVVGEPPKAPWHFKLLLLATVVYLGYRAWQGIDWLVGKLL